MCHILDCHTCVIEFRLPSPLSHLPSLTVLLSYFTFRFQAQTLYCYCILLGFSLQYESDVWRNVVKSGVKVVYGCVEKVGG